jgi:hypothetical protein
MKTHRVTGGGGVQLHVVEAGNERGRPSPTYTFKLTRWDEKASLPRDAIRSPCFDVLEAQSIDKGTVSLLVDVGRR